MSPSVVCDAEVLGCRSSSLGVSVAGISWFELSPIDDPGKNGLETSADVSITGVSKFKVLIIPSPIVFDAGIPWFGLSPFGNAGVNGLGTYSGDVSIKGVSGSKLIISSCGFDVDFPWFELSPFGVSGNCIKPPTCVSAAGAGPSF